VEKKSKVTKIKDKNPITIKQVLELLESKTLSQEERILILNYLNKGINTFPLDDLILFRQDGAMLYNGNELPLEQMQNFKQSADALKNNLAFKIICDQVMFKAIKVGIHESKNIDEVIFSKTAIYFVDLFKKNLQKIK